MRIYVKVGLFLASVAALAAGTYWYNTREVAVPTLQAETDVEIRAFGVGTVEAQILSKVGFHIGGKLTTIAADQGDVVKAGTLLAKLDDSAQRGRVAKGEVALRQASVNLAKVDALRQRSEAAYQQRKNVNIRRQALVGRGAVSQEAAEETQASEDIARNDLKIAEAEVSIAIVAQEDAATQQEIESVLLNQHELRAPFDSRVIARHKELGSIAGAGESVYTLIAPETIWVRAYIDEAVAGGIAVGQTALVRLRSEPGSSVRARVVRIDQENDRVTEERRVFVRCAECTPQHNLRYLGEQAEVEILKKTVARGLFVPSKFVAISGPNGNVWTIEQNRLRKRTITLGERTADGRI
jgi:HlyD family secretion protein